MGEGALAARSKLCVSFIWLVHTDLGDQLNELCFDLICQALLRSR